MNLNPGEIRISCEDLLKKEIEIFIHRNYLICDDKFENLIEYLNGCNVFQVFNQETIRFHYQTIRRMVEEQKKRNELRLVDFVGDVVREDGKVQCLKCGEWFTGSSNLKLKHLKDGVCHNLDLKQMEVKKMTQLSRKERSFKKKRVKIIKRKNKVVVPSMHPTQLPMMESSTSRGSTVNHHSPSSHDMNSSLHHQELSSRHNHSNEYRFEDDNYYRQLLSTSSPKNTRSPYHHEYRFNPEMYQGPYEMNPYHRGELHRHSRFHSDHRYELDRVSPPHKARLNHTEELHRTTKKFDRSMELNTKSVNGMNIPFKKSNQERERQDEINVRREKSLERNDDRRRNRTIDRNDLRELRDHSFKKND